jgi:hypothetical protein
LIGRWRIIHCRRRPSSRRGYRPPDPKVGYSVRT